VCHQPVLFDHIISFISVTKYTVFETISHDNHMREESDENGEFKREMRERAATGKN
jgi:hypothetical protein